MSLRRKTFLLLVLITWMGGVAASGEDFPWGLFERSAECLESLHALGPGVVPCGSYGLFFFGATDPQAPGCTKVGSGTESDPPRYPQPKQLSGLELDQFRNSASETPLLEQAAGFSGDIQTDARLGGRGKMEDLPRDWFGPPGAEHGTQPWVAVLDWADAHGLAVGMIIEALVEKQATVSLLPLDGKDLDFIGQAVTDFHVLARVCEVAEWVEEQGVEPPKVVNMSFGRLPEEDLDRTLDAEDCGSQRGAPGIACQLGQVIQHVTDLGEPGDTTFIAAGGNHREMLSPAGSRRVLAAGAMDLAQYRTAGRIIPSWETPEVAPEDPSTGIQALLPGDGLCIGGKPVAAGSSFSAAVASGWFAWAKVKDPYLDPLAVDFWAPSVDEGSFLAQDGHTLISGHRIAGEMMKHLGICWQADRKPDEEGVHQGVERDIVVPGPPQTAQHQPAYPSFDTWVAAHHPAPEPDFCVPCQGGGGGFKSMQLTVRSKNEPPPESGDIVLLMQPNASSQLPEGQRLIELYLRAGEKFYPIPMAQEQLDDLAAGKVHRLVLKGYGRLVDERFQSSLVTVVATGSQPLQPFWSSTPLILP